MSNLQIPAGRRHSVCYRPDIKELCAEHRPVNRIASTNGCSCNSANAARTEEGAGPHYEYLCLACSMKFSIVLTLAEHEKSRVRGPKCGSRKASHPWPPSYPTTSNKHCLPVTS